MALSREKTNPRNRPALAMSFGKISTSEQLLFEWNTLLTSVVLHDRTVNTDDLGCIVFLAFLLLTAQGQAPVCIVC